ncbi:MAG TPA: hypothetical protein VKP58_17110 [Candidatus Acidoferrum sp.]|nr:hypothetical protein [Candidatus Acidoferrum sp.]
MRDSIHLAITAVALLVATTLFVEWRSEIRDRAKLQATLDKAEQSLERANAAQQDRDRQLNDAVGKLEALKATVVTQQQILARLPDVLSLPKPIVMQQAPNPSAAPESRVGTSVARAGATHDAPTPTTTAIPNEDLKPLYDFAVDCKTCQARLATATADLADEKSKTQALGRERDAALKLARGGSLRQRLGRAMKWFVIGAIAGAIAAKAH